MTDRGERVMATRTTIATILAVVAIATTVTVVVSDALLGWPSAGSYLIFAPVVVAFASVGWLLAARRPGNVIGLLCIAFALSFAWYFPVDLLLRLGYDDGPVAIAATLSSASDAPAFILLAMILVLFPDGAVPGPRWRWTVWLAAIGIAASFVGYLLQAGPLPAFPTVTNPLGVGGYPGEAIGLVGYVAVVALLVAAVVALVVRWRRGTALERAQVKWVAAASAIVLIGEGANLATFDAADPLGNPITVIGGTVATAIVPVAIGIAILRYRLYEIDRIISRTLGWALVTVLLVAVFAVGVVGLQWALSGVTQGQTLAVAASTLVAFALFQPVRRRVQRAVDHRFDRARYDAELTASAFADRLRDETDIATVTGDLAMTVERSMRPSAAGLWLRGQHTLPTAMGRHR